VLRVSRLRLLFVSFTFAQIISLFGDRLHQFSVIGMIGKVAPGSSFDLFQFALFSYVPILFLAPIFGALLDRTDKVAVLVIVDFARGAIVFGIPTLYYFMGSLYAFYISAFLLALANLMFAPAKSAVIPQIFGGPRLHQVNAVLWTLGIVGTILGLLLGGWIFDYRSWEMSFYCDGTSYLVSAIFLVPLIWAPRAARAPRRTMDPTPERSLPWYAGISGTIASIRDGVKLIRKNRSIALCVITQTSLFGLAGVLYVIGIARVQELFPQGKTLNLSIIGSALTVGLLVGSFLAVLIRGHVSSSRTIAYSTLLCGISLTGFGGARSMVPMTLYSFLMGIAMSPAFILTETVLQEQIPEAFRGRVFSSREVVTKTAFLAVSLLATAAAVVLDKVMMMVALGLFLAITGLLLRRRNFLDV
jgi:DHA3 family macrolide efflux protein-like MFS transporter